ncbi:MAG: hypothetical protein AB9846_15230 [Tenuifilaceae bacterium]
MNLKKYIVRYGWFVLLLLIAIYYLIFRYNSGTIKPSSKDFAVKDTSSITTIVLTQDSVNISLDRTEKGWLINNSFNARPNSVQSFLNVIARLDTRSPLPKSVSDSLFEVMDLSGINVKIYADSRIIIEYKIYSTNALGLGTIGKLNDSKLGFALQLRGFKDDIYSLFILDPEYWKSNKLFIANINQISKIDVEIPEKPEKSFSITLDEKDIKLRATYFDKNLERFDTARVVNFIMNLTDLSYEKLLSKSSVEDKAAIVLSEPNQIFTITLRNMNKLVLKTYPIPIDEYRDEFGRTIKFDLNRLYISFNNDAIIAIASYMAFDPVLQDLSSFRVKN